MSQPSGAPGDYDPNKVEVVRMRWSDTELCCGDPVVLEVVTRNVDPGQVVQVWARRTDPCRCTTMDDIPVEVIGNKTEHLWISRWRFRFREKFPAVAVQNTLQGAEKSSNALEFRNPPQHGKETIQKPGYCTSPLTLLVSQVPSAQVPSPSPKHVAITPHTLSPPDQARPHASGPPGSRLQLAPGESARFVATPSTYLSPAEHRAVLLLDTGGGMDTPDDHVQGVLAIEMPPLRIVHR